MPKAIVCRELGPPESLRLEHFASVPLEQGQVRVAIHAAGINFPDILMVAGEYQLKPELPFTPGVEAAGEVTRGRRRGQGVAVGDKVIVKMRHGAYADEAVVAAVAAHADAVDLRLRRGRDVSRRPRHRLSRADRSRAAQAGRSAAGAWRRRRCRPCRGRDGQDARCDRDRRGLKRREARRREGEGRRSRRCCTDASRSATPSSASPMVAAPMWCSIPSAARSLKRACAASPGARGFSSSASPAASGLPAPISC